MYYIPSNGNIIELEDFISYANYLSVSTTSFIFFEWFSEVDFPDLDTYNNVIELFKIK